MKRLLIAGVLLAAQGMANAAEPVMTVTLLGTGVPLLNADAFARSGRAMSGLMVQAGTERMLFDCGGGVYTRLTQLTKRMSPLTVYNVGVDKVFLSHLHTDHIADLAPLYALGALYRHTEPFSPADIGVKQITVPLKVWGPGAGPNQPVGTWAMMQNFRMAYDSDFYVRQLFTGAGSVVFNNDAVETLDSTVEIPPKGGVLYNQNGVTVTAFLVNHEPVSPSYGFRVDYKGKSFVYSGDTAPDENVVKFSKGADVLVHEVYGYAREDGAEIYDYHTSPEDAATKVFSKAKPKQVVYSHIVMDPFTPGSDTPEGLINRTRKAGYKGKLAAGQDLMAISINDDNTITIDAPEAQSKANRRKATSPFIEVAQAKGMIAP